MGMRTWITSLATFGATVTGVTHSYDLDAIPDKIARSMLPVLIAIPELEEDSGLTFDAMMGGAPHDAFTVTHRLLYAETANLNIRQALPGMITQRDNYIAAAVTQRWLAAETGNNVPITFAANVGVTAWGDVEYHSIDFKYRVRINL